MEDELREEYLAGFFRPGGVREVLGMRLVSDPERAKRTFPEHQRGKLPQVFVEEPGPLAEPMGLGDLAEGDALWRFRDDTARFRDMCFESTAAFVTGVVERHHPRVRTGLSFVNGRDRPDRPPRGWAGCRSILAPEPEIGDLCTLARELRAYARVKRLPLPRSRRHHERGPYWLHVLRRRFGGRTFRRDGRKMIVTADRSVHEQYWSILHRELVARAPLDIVVGAESGRVVFEPAGDTPGAEARARELATGMVPYELGSAWWLVRHLRRIAGKYGTLKRPDGTEIVYSRISRWQVRITAMRAAGDP